MSTSGPTAAHRSRVLTARQVADRLGRSIDWVREHRSELGVLEASGVRPRLLFDPAAVEAFATARTTNRLEPVSPAPAARSKRLRSNGSVDLLPIGRRHVA